MAPPGGHKAFQLSCPQSPFGWAPAVGKEGPQRCLVQGASSVSLPTSHSSEFPARNPKTPCPGGNGKVSGRGFIKLEILRHQTVKAAKLRRKKLNIGLQKLNLALEKEMLLQSPSQQGYGGPESELTTAVSTAKIPGTAWLAGWCEGEISPVVRERKMLPVQEINSWEHHGDGNSRQRGSQHRHTSKSFPRLWHGE